MTTAIRIGPWEGVLPQLRDVGNVGHARFNVRVNTRREGLPPLEGGGPSSSSTTGRDSRGAPCS
jgi:hypothetical protein